MAAMRLNMRKIREVLRLKWECQYSDRKTARSCGLSRPAVVDYVCRAQAAGLSWPLPDDTMVPDFPEGGVLYMDPDLEPRSGDYVLAVTDTGGVTFKRLIQDGGQTFLRPLNPVYTVQRVADLKTYGVLRRLVVTRDFRH